MPKKKCLKTALKRVKISNNAKRSAYNQHIVYLKYICIVGNILSSSENNNIQVRRNLSLQDLK